MGDGGRRWNGSVRRYDLVVLDLMCRAYCIAIVRAIRRGGPTQDVPVLMLTARARERQGARLESGADDYLASLRDP